MAGTVTRSCAFPGCNDDFECESNSNRKYCAAHRGGRISIEESASPKLSQKEIDEAADRFFQEKINDWLNERVPLPPIPEHILATRLQDMGFNTPQHGVALLSDSHYGSKIDPRVTGGLAYYDMDIARMRGARWRDGILRFTQQDQTLLTLDTLHLFALGDDIEGHGEMFPTQKLGMTDSVGFVMMDFVADMSEIILSFLSRYKKIIVYKVRGNHGRISASAKSDYPPDNLELLMWNNIADRVRFQTGGEWSEGPNGVRQLTGGLVDFYIYPSFLAFIQIFDFNFVIRHGDRLKGIASTYCVTPGTRVLTDDARWVKVEDLKVGDGLFGFEDEPSQRLTGTREYKTRHYQRAQVVGTGIQIAPVYKITFADGTSVRATGEHKWITRFSSRQNAAYGWVSTEEMHRRLQDGWVDAGGNRRKASKIVVPRFFVPWDGGLDDWDSGFLAGAFDADGSLSQGKKNRWPVIRFTQYDNELLAEVEAALTRKGFTYTKTLSQIKKHGPIYTLRLTGGRSEQLRFLGQIRPPRLLARFSEIVLESCEMRPCDEVEVVSVEPDGEAPVVALTSSSGTYITEYGASHNTGLIDNKFRMNAIVGEVINYYLIAHHHEAQNIENEIGGESMVNGCWVGPSLLSVSMQRPAASIPSQEFFLLHPRHGITNRHRIRLATKEEMRDLIHWTGRTPTPVLEALEAAVA